jgi:hypothetical protein
MGRMGELYAHRCVLWIARDIIDVGQQWGRNGTGKDRLGELQKCNQNGTRLQ